MQVVGGAWSRKMKQNEVASSLVVQSQSDGVLLQRIFGWLRRRHVWQLIGRQPLAVLQKNEIRQQNIYITLTLM